MRTHRRLGAALLFGAFLLAGCEDSTGPEIQDDTFDADAALADYAAFEDILNADEFASFRALAGRTPFSGPASGMAVVSGLLEADAPVNSRAFALDLMGRVRAAEAAPPVAAAPIISIWTRGATYTYSPELDRYQLAAGREGAPGNGCAVRPLRRGRGGPAHRRGGDRVRRPHRRGGRQPGGHRAAPRGGGGGDHPPGLPDDPDRSVRAQAPSRSRASCRDRRTGWTSTSRSRGRTRAVRSESIWPSNWASRRGTSRSWAR
jgi:hypothetical protein